MPYIVTVTPREPEGWEDDSDFAPSRRAVATLDEAWGAVWSELTGVVPLDEAMRRSRDFRRSAPEQGGTISLLNGTVIEVARVSVVDLAVQVRYAFEVGRGPNTPEGEAGVIAAYNDANA